MGSPAIELPYSTLLYQICGRAIAVTEASLRDRPYNTTDQPSIPAANSRTLQERYRIAEAGARGPVHQVFDVESILS